MKGVVVILSLLWVVFGQCPPKLGNCFIFPPDEEWNRPVDADPIDFRSSCILDAMDTMAAGSFNGAFVRLGKFGELYFNIRLWNTSKPRIWNPFHFNKQQ